MLTEVPDFDEVLSMDKLVFLLVEVPVRNLKFTIDDEVEVMIFLALVNQQVSEVVFLVKFGPRALPNDNSFRAIEENLPVLGQIEQNFLLKILSTNLDQAEQ